MSIKPDAKPSNTEANIVMNPTVEWSEKISLIAGPFRETDTKESWLARAARLSGSTFWHVKSLYEGKLKDPKYSVAYKILSAADRARIEEARRDGEKLAHIYQNLSRVDENFHRIQIDAFVSTLRNGGGSDSA